MANKKQIEARQRALKKQQTDRTIQILGGVALVLIVAGIIWLVWSGGRSNETASPTEQAVDQTAETSTTPEQTVDQYSAPPPMTIDTSKQYFATFKMAKGGEFVVQLFPDKAPKTVNSFVFLYFLACLVARAAGRHTRYSRKFGARSAAIATSLLDHTGRVPPNTLQVPQGKARL